MVGGGGSYPDFTANSDGSGSLVGAFVNALLLRCGPLEEFDD